MNKILCLVTVSLLVVGCNNNSYQATELDNAEAVDAIAMKAAGLERYIIESEADDDLEAAITAERGSVVRRLQTVKGVVAYLPAQAAQRLEARFGDLIFTPDIELLGVPSEISASGKPGGTSPPPAQSIPWGISRIGAREANALNKGAGIKVCVVDSGIDKTHPDLAANISGGRNYVVIKGRIAADNWNDDNGHGSHVAGTIAAIENTIGAVGVAPEAKLFAAKVLDSRGSGYLSDVADGVTECVRVGAKVINMSLGANGDPNAASPLKTAILNAQTAGVLVVVAAGNEGQDVRNTIPAGYPSVIAVSALNSSDQFPSWSNFGLDNNDFAAPGVNIYSTWKGGQYNTISGTSMASPHVAGVAALHLSAQSPLLKAIDLGFSLSEQGQGIIDALGSAQ